MSNDTDGSNISRKDFVKTSAAAAAAVAAGALLQSSIAAAASPRRSTKSTTTLTVATMPGPRWELSLRAAGAKYQKDFPGKTVQFIVRPYTEHLTALATALMTNSPDVDLWVIDAGRIAQSHDKLVGLKQYFSHDKAWTAQYNADIPWEYRGNYDLNGEVYGIMHDANAMMTWYRRDMLEKHGLPVPTTFDIMYHNAKVLNMPPKQYGFEFCVPRGAYADIMFGAFMDAYGGRWYQNDTHLRFGRISKDNPPGKILLDSPECVQALTMMKKLLSVGDPASLNDQEFEDATSFIRGSLQQALTYSGLMLLQNPAKNPHAQYMESRQFPKLTPYSRQGGMKAGFALGIAGGSQRPEEAFLFAQYVVTPGPHGGINAYVQGGGQPTRVPVLREFAKQHKYQVFNTLADAVLTGHPQPNFSVGPQFDQVIGTIVADYLVSNSMSARNAAQQLKAAATDLFKKAGYM